MSRVAIVLVVQLTHVPVNQMAHLATLASIYHKPPDTFIKGQGEIKFHNVEDVEQQESSEEEESSEDEDEDEDTDEDEDEDVNGYEVKQKVHHSESKDEPVDLLGADDLLGLDMGASNTSTSNSGGGDVLDLLGDFDFAPANGGGGSGVDTSVPVCMAFGNDDIGDVQIRSQFARKNNQLVLVFCVENRSNKQLNRFALKLNRNFWGLTPASKISVRLSLVCFCVQFA